MVEDRFFVFVFVEGGYVLCVVMIGIKFGGFVEICFGLMVGEVVVIDGVFIFKV